MVCSERWWATMRIIIYYCQAYCYYYYYYLDIFFLFNLFFLFNVFFHWLLLLLLLLLNNSMLLTKVKSSGLKVMWWIALPSPEGLLILTNVCRWKVSKESELYWCKNDNELWFTIHYEIMRTQSSTPTSSRLNEGIINYYYSMVIIITQ